jgi:hypothetical protein
LLISLFNSVAAWLLPDFAPSQMGNGLVTERLLFMPETAF